MPKIVRSAGEYRRAASGREPEQTGLMPDPVVGRGIEHSPGFAAEQAPIGSQPYRVM
jgi:hypothetical protein